MKNKSSIITLEEFEGYSHNTIIASSGDGGKRIQSETAYVKDIHSGKMVGKVVFVAGRPKEGHAQLVTEFLCEAIDFYNDLR